MRILSRILELPNVLFINGSLVQRLGWLHDIVLETLILIGHQWDHVTFVDKLWFILEWQLKCFLVIKLIFQFLIECLSCCIYYKRHLLVNSLVSYSLALNSINRFERWRYVALLRLWFDWHKWSSVQELLIDRATGLLDVWKSKNSFLNIIEWLRLWIHSSTLRYIIGVQ